MSKSDKKATASSPSQVNPDYEKFCNYPFMQLLLQPTGVISPCCWNQEIILGNIQENSLEEIWNSDQLKKLRNEFLSGNPVSCKDQMAHIGCHRWSRRRDEQNLSFAEVQTVGPRRLDVRLNGRCNLECVMCDVWKQPNGVYDSVNFWEHAQKEIFPHLKEMDVLGGEPFVQKDTFRLIDEISQVNPDCTWAFVTNGQYRLEPIRHRLDKIKIRWLQVSLDSINETTYPKIRVNGVLKQTLKTIDGLMEYREKRAAEGRPFRFNMSMCVQVENWREMGEFLRFAADKKAETTLQFAYKPDAVSLLSLGRETREEIVEYMNDLRNEFPPSMTDSIFLPVRDSLR